MSRILRIARATAHSACGRLAYQLGLHGTARRQFERVLLVGGANFIAYVYLGRIAFDHGDYAGWRREFEHARRTDPIRFARLRHPSELIEPRLAGTQFDGCRDTDGYLATDARATWRALHPFGKEHMRFESDTGNAPSDDKRSPEGFGRNSDIPLAPGYDPMAPGQQLDDRDSVDHLHDNTELPSDAFPLEDNGAADPFGSNRKPGLERPEWATPDASLSRDDFSSPTERRRFQLRRAIDSQEIAHCDLNDLARRLSS